MFTTEPLIAESRSAIWSPLSDVSRLFDVPRDPVRSADAVLIKHRPTARPKARSIAGASPSQRNKRLLGSRIPTSRRVTSPASSAERSGPRSSSAVRPSRLPNADVTHHSRSRSADAALRRPPRSRPPKQVSSLYYLLKVLGVAESACWHRLICGMDYLEQLGNNSPLRLTTHTRPVLRSRPWINMLVLSCAVMFILFYHHNFSEAASQLRSVLGEQDITKLVPKCERCTQISAAINQYRFSSSVLAA